MSALTAADRALLAELSGSVPPGELDVDAALRSPAVYAALFGGPDLDPPHEIRTPGDPRRSQEGGAPRFRGDPGDARVFASPYLVFSVLVNRVAAELAEAAFVDEWLGPGRTVPVFDVTALREFLGEAGRRAFLADLLTSYTRVTSGSVWRRTPRGWRRRRYSELDPVELAQLLEVVDAAQRPAVCRRLGDLALFLSGVFPEHAAAHPLEPRHVERIHRLLDATGLAPPSPPPEELARPGGPQRGLWLLEWLGRRSYRLAVRAGGVEPELSDVAEAFGRARRVLNVLTGRHLHPLRGRWFPSAGPG